MTNNYSVAWRSDQGKPNEGSYIYGPRADVEMELSKWKHVMILSYHSTKIAAENHARLKFIQAKNKHKADCALELIEAFPFAKFHRRAA